MDKCNKLGLHAPCDLEAGHAGVHKNAHEEFVTVEFDKVAGREETEMQAALEWVRAPRDRSLH